MHLQLVIPDLLPSDAQAHPEADDRRYAALELLLARGRRTVTETAGLTTWLAQRFGYGVHDGTHHGAMAGTAALRLLGDGIDPGTDYWLCADPVNLEVGMNSLAIADAAGLAIERVEADALVATLAAHFRDIEVQWHAPAPIRWYIGQRTTPAISTTPLEEARTLPFAAALPQGADGARWRSIVNEIQMLLHEHPVNLAREARGARTINAVWIAGGSRAPAAPLVAPSGPATWFCDSPLARGFALAARQPVRAVPADFARWSTEPVTPISVALLDAGDLLEHLERAWFAPAVAALRAGQIGMVTLVTTTASATLTCEITKRDLGYFWRRPRALQRYVVEH